ncbi:MAG: hypothetical protein L3J95_01345 [Thermoplasmata archaeon]|nr:hypothetical protein [Thermoplasmata archaeon]MCI4359060.1 hypothetical protein [Thermoplasmata archaeon]
MELTGAIGTPPQAWVRLFIAFYLTMMVVLVVFLADRLLGERQSLRIGWTAAVGALTTFAGGLADVPVGPYAGGYIAAAGVIILGLSFVLTSWWGLSAGSRRLHGA